MPHRNRRADPYVQVVVDIFCSLAFAKVYAPKMPITACDLLCERLFPFYEALGVPIGAVLTDNREFCGKPESHPFELSCSRSKGSSAAPRAFARRRRTASSSG